MLLAGTGGVTEQPTLCALSTIVCTHVTHIIWCTGNVWPVKAGLACAHRRCAIRHATQGWLSMPILAAPRHAAEPVTDVLTSVPCRWSMCRSIHTARHMQAVLLLRMPPVLQCASSGRDAWLCFDQHIAVDSCGCCASSCACCHRLYMAAAAHCVGVWPGDQLYGAASTRVPGASAYPCVPMRALLALLIPSLARVRRTDRSFISNCD